MKTIKHKEAGALGPVVANDAKAVEPIKAKSAQVKKQVDDNDPLDEQGEALLAECETDIQENLRGTFVLGWRLEQIRDQKLYRQTHKTFAGYCKEKWDFSKSHANRHIQAYLCEERLKKIKGAEVYIPTKESEVRYIADLDPEQQVDVAKKVKEMVGDKAATAGDFGEAREELFPKPKREADTNKQAKPQGEQVVPKMAHSEFGSNLEPISEIQKIVKNIYNIYTNSSKKQDGMNLFGSLERHLAAWAEWQAKQLTMEVA